MANKSPLELIDEIRAKADAEISKLKTEALAELEDKRKAALATVRGIEDAIAELTGKSTRAKRGSGGSPKAGHPDVASPATLRSLLNKAEGKRLNRKGFNDAGYNLRSALALAKADEKTFGYKQNGPQGEVWLK